jgi:hypothetical protein
MEQAIHWPGKQRSFVNYLDLIRCIRTGMRDGTKVERKKER